MKVQARLIVALIALTLFSWGCAQTGSMQQQAAQSPAIAAKQEATVYKGKILGMSKKARTISIEVGKGDKARTLMVKFDDKTTGLEFAKKGEAAIVNWELRGDDKYATVIKPKLAKLPNGTTEIKTADLRKIVEAGKDFMLIDSRPAGRYNQAHLPGAVSIPVTEMKAKAPGMLPKEKDKLLVFYCGGPT